MRRLFVALAIFIALLCMIAPTVATVYSFKAENDEGDSGYEGMVVIDDDGNLAFTIIAAVNGEYETSQSTSDDVAAGQEAEATGQAVFAGSAAANDDGDYAATGDMALGDGYIETDQQAEVTCHEVEAEQDAYVSGDIAVAGSIAEKDGTSAEAMAYAEGGFVDVTGQEAEVEHHSPLEAEAEQTVTAGGDEVFLETAVSQECGDLAASSTVELTNGGVSGEMEADIEHREAEAEQVMLGSAESADLVTTATNGDEAAGTELEGENAFVFFTMQSAEAERNEAEAEQEGFVIALNGAGSAATWAEDDEGNSASTSLSFDGFGLLETEQEAEVENSRHGTEAEAEQEGLVSGGSATAATEVTSADGESASAESFVVDGYIIIEEQEAEFETSRHGTEIEAEQEIEIAGDFGSAVTSVEGGSGAETVSMVRYGTIEAEQEAEIETSRHGTEVEAEQETSIEGDWGKAETSVEDDDGNEAGTVSMVRDGTIEAEQEAEIETSRHGTEIEAEQHTYIDGDWGKAETTFEGANSPEIEIESKVEDGFIDAFQKAEFEASRHEIELEAFQNTFIVGEDAEAEIEIDDGDGNEAEVEAEVEDGCIDVMQKAEIEDELCGCACSGTCGVEIEAWQRGMVNGEDPEASVEVEDSHGNEAEAEAELHGTGLIELHEQEATSIGARVGGVEASNDLRITGDGWAEIEAEVENSDGSGAEAEAGIWLDSEYGDFIDTLPVPGFGPADEQEATGFIGGGAQAIQNFDWQSSGFFTFEVEAEGGSPPKAGTELIGYIGSDGGRTIQVAYADEDYANAYNDLRLFATFAKTETEVRDHRAYAEVEAGFIDLRDEITDPRLTAGTYFTSLWSGFMEIEQNAETVDCGVEATQNPNIRLDWIGDEGDGKAWAEAEAGYYGKNEVEVKVKLDKGYRPARLYSLSDASGSRYESIADLEAWAYKDASGDIGPLPYNTPEYLLEQTSAYARYYGASASASAGWGRHSGAHATASYPGAATASAFAGP